MACWPHSFGLNENEIEKGKEKEKEKENNNDWDQFPASVQLAVSRCLAILNGRVSPKRPPKRTITNHHLRLAERKENSIESVEFTSNLRPLEASLNLLDCRKLG